MVIEVVAIPKIHGIVFPIVDELLSPLGFTCISNLKWVKGENGPIRYLYELIQWKGGVVAPRFGVSLDFVPHISGSSVKWHRTNKSAQPDLIFDTFDRSIEFPYTKGPDAIKDKAPTTIPKSINIAQDFWKTCSSEDKLLQAFELIRAHYDAGLPEGRSHFERYVPHQLARAFILARRGRKTEASDALEAYIAKSHFKKITSDKLLHLLDIADVT